MPGRVFDPKTGQWYVFTAQDVRDGARNLSTMHVKGRRPPAVWEHQPVEVGDPDEWKANYAKYTFGYLGPGRVSTAADVTRGIASRVGTLIARHDIFDAKDAAQLKRLKVSPKLYRGYQDSDGTEYSGCVPVHSAATPTPCQFQQAPFKFDIELSDVSPLFVAYRKPKSRSRNAKACPLYNRWRGGVALSSTNPETPMADETDDKKPKKGADEGEGKNADLEAIIKALREKFGANISDKVSNWSELLIAIESNGGDADDVPPEEPADDNPDDDLDATGAASGADTTAPAGGAPMLMSTTDAGEKGKRARAEVQADRTDACKLVDRALQEGKCHGIEARRLQRVFGACELSVTADGGVTGPRWNAAMKTLNSIRQRPKQWALTNSVELSIGDTDAGPTPPAQLEGKGESESLKAQIAQQEELARRYSVTSK